MKVFITGSSDGIGLMTAHRLIGQGHTVVLHARNAARARFAKAACPNAAAVLTGDLTSMTETKELAAKANAMAAKLDGGSAGFDIVIHNAGIYRGPDVQAIGDSGYPRLFTVNTLAPYILASLLHLTSSVSHIVFVSSGMHFGGQPCLDTLPNGVSYSDSKLHNALLAKAFARLYAGKAVVTSADPGWVPTKMGGRSAPDSIDDAMNTYIAAATTSTDSTGGYFARGATTAAQAVTEDVGVQDALLAKLAELSGVVPGHAE
ncbi:short-chain dehydrogenase reductase sdr [Ophiostoma piceae UAMH 11346]|uniref:Short-chain dehydrogenase reductase sdr n=1 Tax=Ophiostoma piceae (strain UAMH 11346) TaxID=1262450 RepID=S3C0T6_OPHP1|nr:short-chain dehydrogenase reductase sdr [Ophiostoma piceae UAMH 11346]